MSAHPFAPAPFDGRRFHNRSGRGAQGVADVLRWLLTRRRAPWPAHVPGAPAPKPVDRVDDRSIRATPIGHATVLLQVAGLNILTDPVWSARAGPARWLGVPRVRPPAISLDDLPRIDAVLVSHNHYDHLDRPTLAALLRRDEPRMLTGLRVGSAVPGGAAVELDWWQSHPLRGNARVTYVPAAHSSGRGPFDRDRTLWGGFVVETSSGTIYFAGDTASGDHFAAIRERFGAMTLSLLPIGAYAPRWFMSCVHLDPAEAVAASIQLESAVSVAIHYETFRLSDEAFDAPAHELARTLAARTAEQGLDFRLVAFGQPCIVSR